MREVYGAEGLEAKHHNSLPHRHEARNLVAHALRGDDRDLIGDALVGVEVKRELAVEALANDARRAAERVGRDESRKAKEKKSGEAMALIARPLSSPLHGLGADTALHKEAVREEARRSEPRS